MRKIVPKIWPAKSQSDFVAERLEALTERSRISGSTPGQGK